MVDELGEGVSDVALGDRVFGFAVGSTAAAELALLADYAPIPPSLDFAHAAAPPVAIETATRCLELLDVDKNTSLLINGAAGAVGSSAVQLARACGARVIGTASPGNHDYLRSLWSRSTSPLPYVVGSAPPDNRTRRHRRRARRCRRRRAPTALAGSPDRAS